MEVREKEETISSVVNYSATRRLKIPELSKLFPQFPRINDNKGGMMNLKIWLTLSILVSIFWGVRSAFLFVNTPKCGLSEQFPRWGRFFIYSYQFIFNFVGSMAGWACFYILVVRVSIYYPSMEGFNVTDLWLFIFSVIGLTGHLPQSTYGLVESFSKFANALAKKYST